MVESSDQNIDDFHSVEVLRPTARGCHLGRVAAHPVTDGDLVALEVVVVWAPLSLVPCRSHDPNIAATVLLQDVRVEVVNCAGLDTVSAWIWKIFSKIWVV